MYIGGNVYKNWKKVEDEATSLKKKTTNEILHLTNIPDGLTGIYKVLPAFHFVYYMIYLSLHLMK